MKVINNILILIIAFAIYSCNPADMTTIVHNDGSCERIFTQPVNEQFMMGDTSQKPFPIATDSDWKITLKWLQSGKEKVADWPLKQKIWNANDSISDIVAIATRHYSSVQQMASQFRFKNDHEWHNIIPKPSLVKKFRWFYTYYDYSEVFPKLNVAIPIPIEKFMTKDEAAYWLTGQPDLTKGMSGIEANEFSSQLENHFNDWKLNNIWEIQYGLLLKNLSLFPGNPGNEKMLAAKDSILAVIKKSDKKDIENYEIGNVLNKYFKTTAFAPLLKNESAVIKEINEPSVIKEMENYFNFSANYKLILPGKVMETNGVIAHDTISWKIDAYRMLNDDYAMKAGSKKLNTLIALISALIVLLAVFLIFRRT